MNLNELIKYYKVTLDLSLQSRTIAESTLKELEGKKELLARVNDEMLTKMCYRLGHRMPEGCDICTDCMSAEKLQWNEGDE
jgi:hypothetical protein